MVDAPALLRRELWPSLRGMLRDPGFLALPCFEAGATSRWLDAFEAGRERELRAVWRLYALALWRAQFDVRFG